MKSTDSSKNNNHCSWMRVGDCGKEMKVELLFSGGKESFHFGSLQDYKGWKKWRVVPNDLHCYLGPLHYPRTMEKPIISKIKHPTLWSSGFEIFELNLKNKTLHFLHWKFCLKTPMCSNGQSLDFVNKFVVKDIWSCPISN